MLFDFKSPVGLWDGLKDDGLQDVAKVEKKVKAADSHVKGADVFSHF
jgi:hypothetical protein